MSRADETIDTAAGYCRHHGIKVGDVLVSDKQAGKVVVTAIGERCIIVRDATSTRHRWPEQIRSVSHQWYKIGVEIEKAEGK